MVFPKMELIPCIFSQRKVGIGKKSKSVYLLEADHW